MRLSGLEPFTLTKDIPFVNVGERTNVTGSAKFRKLITAGDYAAALDVARDQVANGAQIIDINMDEGLIDSKKAMVEYLNLIAAEPDIARVPVMIDSSKWEIIEAGLKCVQGKPLVNSISMKEGEEAFLHHAKLCRAYGAAVVVMAFDEEGQADTQARKVEICTRAYKLLTEQAGFPPEDIVFDPNIFAMATGIEEHNNYGVDFIEATREIIETLPHVHISGGVSNLSFSFRGNEPVREAMHAVFLYHAIQAGMDMGIVNAGQLAVYESDRAGTARGLRGCRPQPPRRFRPSACWRLAERFKGTAGKEAKERDLELARMAGRKAHRARAGQRHHRIHRCRHRGGAARRRAAAACHRRPADGRHERRRRPLRRRKDVPAASGEVRARDEAGGRRSAAAHGGRKAGERGKGMSGDERQTAGKILMATVKGDVHDIGKNIVGVVLACNNYEIIDLGVMVPATKDPADGAGTEGRHHRPVRPDHAVARRDGACGGRNGARRFRHSAADRRRDDQPRAHGGQDPSALHQGPDGLRHRRQPRRRRGFKPAVAGRQGRLCRRRCAAEYKKVADAHARNGSRTSSACRSQRRAPMRRRSTGTAYEPPKPSFLGTRVFQNWDLAELARYIDWTPFFQTWELKGRYPKILEDETQGPAARQLFDDAQAMLEKIIAEKWFAPKAVIGFWPANAVGDDIRLFTDEGRARELRHLLHAAPATGQARRQAERRAVRFRRA